jgi:hypothetical protein
VAAIEYPVDSAAGNPLRDTAPVNPEPDNPS